MFEPEKKNLIETPFRGVRHMSKACPTSVGVRDLSDTRTRHSGEVSVLHGSFACNVLKENNFYPVAL